MRYIYLSVLVQSLAIITESGDPETKSEEKKTDDIKWAVDSYALLKPKTSCPGDFTDSTKLEIKNSKITVLGSSNLDSESTTDGSLTTKKCLKTPKTDEAKTELPDGSYCMINEGAACPTNLALVTISVGSPAAELLKICCRKIKSGKDEDAVKFPIEVGFILIRSQEKCPSISGADVTNDHIKITSKLEADKLTVTQTGDNFKNTVNTDSTTKLDSVTLDLCIYKKIEKPKDKDKKSKKGLIIGIVCGVVALLLIIGGVMYAKSRG